MYGFGWVRKITLSVLNFLIPPDLPEQYVAVCMMLEGVSETALQRELYRKLKHLEMESVPGMLI